jgi:hypothetical protein
MPSPSPCPCASATLNANARTRYAPPHQAGAMPSPKLWPPSYPMGATPNPYMHHAGALPPMKRAQRPIPNHGPPFIQRAQRPMLAHMCIGPSHQTGATPNPQLWPPSIPRARRPRPTPTHMRTTLHVNGRGEPPTAVTSLPCNGCDARHQRERTHRLPSKPRGATSQHQLWAPLI